MGLQVAALGGKSGGVTSRWFAWVTEIASVAAAIVFAASAGLALAGCDGETVASTAGGAEVFKTMCSTCHGLDGKPPPAMVVRIGVRDLTEPEFRARVTRDLVEHQVRTGSKSKLMPAFEGALSDAQIKAVAAFVASPQFAARH
jgi:mono/diheme cytochrome c family protein